MKLYDFKVLFVLLAVGLMWGCAGPEPKIQEGPTAETTFDGLVAVDNTVYQKVWVKPDIDLSQYDKMMLKGAEVDYRAVGLPGGARYYSSRQEFFPMSEKDKEDFEKLVSEGFRKELEKSKYFEIVQEPGPTTLIVEGTLIDVVSRVPPEIGGRDVYVSSYGEATLVIQLYDSMSDEILARAADRRAAQDVTAMNSVSSTPATAVSATMEVNRMVTTWGQLLTNGIDYLHEMPPVETAAE